MEDTGETKARNIQQQLSVGTPVYVNYENYGTWYLGRWSVHPTDTYDIRYDDDDQEYNVPRRPRIFSLSELPHSSQFNSDVERELWNNAPFGRAHIMAGENFFGIYPSSVILLDLFLNYKMRMVIILP